MHCRNGTAGSAREDAVGPRGTSRGRREARADPGLDPAGEVQRSFQAVGVPESYLVSGDGRLLWVRRGGLHDAGDSVRVALDRAVEQLR